MAHPTSTISHDIPMGPFEVKSLRSFDPARRAYRLFPVEVIFPGTAKADALVRLIGAPAPFFVSPLRIV